MYNIGGKYEKKFFFRSFNFVAFLLTAILLTMYCKSTIKKMPMEVQSKFPAVNFQVKMEKVKPSLAEYYKILEKEFNSVRYKVEDDRAALFGVMNPDNKPIPVKLIIKNPKKAEAAKGDMLFIINTLDENGKPAGGLTLKLEVKKDAQDK